MNLDNTALQINKIQEFLRTQNITPNKIEILQENNRVIDYLIDKKFILKISKSVLDEQMKLDRVKSLSLVPQIYSSGSFTASGRDYYFLIIDYVEGNELFSVLQELSEEQSVNIGKEIAGFLTELHSISDSFYDIGHYIPTIPRYRQSWKEGHLEYMKILQNGLSNLNIVAKSKDIISSAFDYITANIECLEYQSGAKLLHNDFHPKNIIINKGRLAGIIDWECSQFGEADFELTHLFHWCIYPPKSNGSFELLLKSVFVNLMGNLKIPNIVKRLTIYQLEHELNQLIWNGIKQEEERTQRISGWLDGQIEFLIEKWQIQQIYAPKRS